MDYSQNIILPKFKPKCNVILKLDCQQLIIHPYLTAVSVIDESHLRLT